MALFLILLSFIGFVALLMIPIVLYFVIKKRNSQANQNREFHRPDRPNFVRPDKPRSAEVRRQERLASHQKVDARLRQKHRLIDDVIGVDRITSNNPQYEWPSVPEDDKKTNGW
jgi:hypothetical protein